MAPVQLQGIWRTTASQDEVWEVVSDLGRWRDWWPAIAEVRTRGAGGSGLPDTAELVFDTVVGRLDVPVDVRTSEPPERIVVGSAGGGFEGQGTLTIRATEVGSDVSYDFSVRTTKLWLRPVEMVLRTATRSGGKQRLYDAGDRLADLAGGEPLRHDV